MKEANLLENHDFVVVGREFVENRVAIAAVLKRENHPKNSCEFIEFREL
jgi:hypothetical protein